MCKKEYNYEFIKVKMWIIVKSVKLIIRVL
jgi:hypothetical protein